MFDIPTLPDLVKRMRQAFRAELPGSDAWLWPNNVAASAKVFAGGLSELFGRLDYVGRQAFVLTAEERYLARHGEQYGMARRAADLAYGAVLVSGADALQVARGAVFRRSDGVEFAATAAATLAAPGTVTVKAAALASGSGANSQPGTPLVIVSGLSGPGAASATAAVDAAGFIGGRAVESTEEYRERILFRLRNPPHGGAAADYVQWALTVPGVTRVFVERLQAGPGTLRVFGLWDDVFAAAGGVPDAAHVLALRETLEVFKPAAAALTVAAPAPHLIDVTISGLDPATEAQREQVRRALAEAVRRYGRVAGADTPVASMPYLATPYSFSRSWLSQAIADSAGELRHVLAAPAADVAIAAGEIPVLGAVTFT